jgi:hypothetical protein
LAGATGVQAFLAVTLEGVAGDGHGSFLRTMRLEMVDQAIG